MRSDYVCVCVSVRVFAFSFGVKAALMKGRGS